MKRQEDNDSNSAGNKNVQAKQYLYIFPHHITTYWSKCMQQIDKIARSQYVLKDQMYEVITSLHQLHYSFPNQDFNIKNFQSVLDSMDNQEIDALLFGTFTEMAQLILKTKTLFPESIILLLSGTADDLMLSKQQVCCVLAHMFFCTTHQ